MEDRGFRTVGWEDGKVVLLDQTLLPSEETYVRIETEEELARAIRTLQVRGAPAIGIAAAHGAALAPPRHAGGRDKVLAACDLLASTRPTAVNLFWALERSRAVVRGWEGDAAGLEQALLEEAGAVAREQDLADRRMGGLGAALLPAGCKIITHCNAGGLATLSFGTALGVIKAAHAAGKIAVVWVDETRPLLQGARLTAWEMERAGIPYRVICDNMAASVMARGEADAVITGADRIAANGDTANKIGTYPLAVLAGRHGIPFYVAAPLSTLDPATASGEDIPIEEREAGEVRACGGRQLTPREAPAWNPAFDVTPADLIAAIVTEAGVARAPYRESLRLLMEGGGAA
jgi:methylthioribose-1-phosphate isomerase